MEDLRKDAAHRVAGQREERAVTELGTQAEVVDPAEVGLSAPRLDRVRRGFARYVDDGRLPGFLVSVTRYGRLAYLATAGLRDVEKGLAVEPDTVFRLYSMTKPVTSVAALMLFEEGGLELTDPVSRFLPSFADLRVYRGGPAARPVTEPASEPVRIWHLLTHTAGLTYGFHRAHVVDEMYRMAGYDWGVPPEVDLATACDPWAGLPLLFEPGTEWNYSVATDVLGRVVEVVSGMRLDRFFAERILVPLGMVDTGFEVPADRSDRLAALYARSLLHGGLRRLDRTAPLAPPVGRPPRLLSGGGGLVGTAADYQRFLLMLLGGGELDGVRLLAPRTVAYLTRNQLPGGADLAGFGRPLHAETSFAGVGFGLGVAVVVDPVACRNLTSAGEYSWGGAASTAFYVDPAARLTVVFLTQLMPSSAYPLRSQLRQLVSQALLD